MVYFAIYTLYQRIPWFIYLFYLFIVYDFYMILVDGCISVDFEFYTLYSLAEYQYQYFVFEWALLSLRKGVTQASS